MTILYVFAILGFAIVLGMFIALIDIYGRDSKEKKKKKLSPFEEKIIDFSNSISKFLFEGSVIRLDPVIKEYAELDEQYESLFHDKVEKEGVSFLEVIWHYGRLYRNVEKYFDAIDSSRLPMKPLRCVDQCVKQYDEILKEVLVTFMKSDTIKRYCTILLSSFSKDSLVYSCDTSNDVEMIPYYSYSLMKKIFDGQFHLINEKELRTASEYLLRMDLFEVYKNNENFKKGYDNKNVLIGYSFANNNFEYVLESKSATALGFSQIDLTPCPKDEVSPSDKVSFVLMDKREFVKRVKKVSVSKDIINLVKSL